VAESDRNVSSAAVSPQIRQVGRESGNWRSNPVFGERTRNVKDEVAFPGETQRWCHKQAWQQISRVSCALILTSSDFSRIACPDASRSLFMRRKGPGHRAQAVHFRLEFSQSFHDHVKRGFVPKKHVLHTEIIFCKSCRCLG